MPKIAKRCYQIFVNAICPKRFPLKPENQNGSVTTTKIHDGNFQPSAPFERSDSYRLDLQERENHRDCDFTLHHTNHENVENGISNELINDLISDNIALKNELEKVQVETKLLNRKFDEIDSRVKQMNDVCDIVLVDIVKDGSNNKMNHNKTSQTTETKHHKKALLCP